MSRRSAAGQLTLAIAVSNASTGVRVLRRRRVAQDGERALDVGAIRVELRFERRVQVVIAVRQADAGLTQIERVHDRLRGIRVHAGSEDAAAESAVRLAHVLRERRLVGDGRHALEIRLKGLVVELLDGRLVHEALIHPAKLGRRRRVLDDRANLLLREVEDVVADAGRRLIVGDLCLRGPRAVHEAIEIVTGVDRAIHRREIHAPRAEVPHRGRCRGRPGRLRRRQRQRLRCRLMRDDDGAERQRQEMPEQTRDGRKGWTVHATILNRIGCAPVACAAADTRRPPAAQVIGIPPTRSPRCRGPVPGETSSGGCRGAATDCRRSGRTSPFPRTRPALSVPSRR